MPASELTFKTNAKFHINLLTCAILDKLSPPPCLSVFIDKTRFQKVLEFKRKSMRKHLKNIRCPTSRKGDNGDYDHNCEN